MRTAMSATIYTGSFRLKLAVFATLATLKHGLVQFGPNSRSLPRLELVQGCSSKVWANTNAACLTWLVYQNFQEKLHCHGGFLVSETMRSKNLKN